MRTSEVGRAALARTTLSVSITFCIVAVLAGCGTTEGDDPTSAPISSPSVYVEMSRAVMYESVKQLADDSDVIVVGTVVSQETVGGVEFGDDVTLSTLVVVDTVKGEGTDVGETLIVRQLGSVNLATEYPLMQVGTLYLAYLIESGLPGEQASHYFITGVIAGLYAAPPESDTYNSLSSDEFAQVHSDGDIQPSTISLDEAVGKEHGPGQVTS